MSDVNRDLFSEIVFSAVEFTRSNGTDVAGKIKNFIAIFLNTRFKYRLSNYWRTGFLFFGYINIIGYAKKTGIW